MGDGDGLIGKHGGDRIVLKRRKRCSSLGRLRIAALVSVDKGKHKQHCLLDIKEAPTPTCSADVEAVMPHNEAERVVGGAPSDQKWPSETVLPSSMRCCASLSLCIRAEAEQPNQVQAQISYGGSRASFAQK